MMSELSSEKTQKEKPRHHKNNNLHGSMNAMMNESNPSSESRGGCGNARTTSSIELNFAINTNSNNQNKNTIKLSESEYTTCSDSMEMVGNEVGDRFDGFISELIQSDDSTGQNHEMKEYDNTKLVQRTKSQNKVWEWLDQIPSSPESPKSDNNDHNLDIYSKETPLTPNVTPNANNDLIYECEDIKERLLNDNFLSYTTDPAQIKTKAEREYILQDADSKISEINKQIFSQPDYQPYSFISGTASWDQKSKNLLHCKKPPLKCFNLENIFAWFGKFSIIQWFFKTQRTVSSTETKNPDEGKLCSKHGSSDEVLKNQQYPSAIPIFLPFIGKTDNKGVILETNKLFSGDDVQVDVKLALCKISEKLNKITSAPKENTGDHILMSIEFPCKEVVPKLQLEPQETLSMEEIKLLTGLISTSRQKKNNAKMRTIFGFRETRPGHNNTQTYFNHRNRQRTQRLSLWQRFSMLWRSRQQISRRNQRRRRSHSLQLHQLDAQNNQDFLNQAQAIPIEVVDHLPQQIPHRNFLRNIVAQAGNGILRLFGFRRDNRVFPEAQPVGQENQQEVDRDNNSNRIRLEDDLRRIQRVHGSISRRNPLRHRLRLLELIPDYPDNG